MRFRGAQANGRRLPRQIFRKTEGLKAEFSFSVGSSDSKKTHYKGVKGSMSSSLVRERDPGPGKMRSADGILT
jgi:hypothetical protein